MKNFNGKSFFMGLIIGVLAFSGIAVAFAASYNVNLEATYRDIKVYIDDQSIDYTASNGAYAEPFIINGTTYIPLRLFSEKLGQQVQWDDQTSSIFIGSHTQIPADADIIAKVYDFALKNQAYPEDEYYRYERNQSDAEILLNADPACVIGVPVCPINKETGEPDSGAVDFYWYEKSTGVIKYIGGGQDWNDEWVDINTGEWKGPTD